MTELLKKLFEEARSPLKAERLMEAGIPYKQVLELEEKEIIKRYKSAYYIMPGIDLSEDEIVAGLFKDGVLTMESALFFHGYIDKKPERWTIAISKNTSKSRFKSDYPAIIPFYTEPRVLLIGAEPKVSNTLTFNIYNKDRLICDVLKYEEKLTRTIFQKALKSYIEDPEKNLLRLMEYAIERKVQKKVKMQIIPWMDEIPEQLDAKKPISRNTRGEALSEEPKRSETITKQYDKEDLPDERSSMEKLIDVYTRIGKGEIQIRDIRLVAETVRILLTEHIDGKKVWNKLEGSVSGDIVENVYKMQNLWAEYEKRHNKMSFSWEEAKKVLIGFGLPIFTALDRGDGFVGDWMPELGRFL